MDHLTEPHITVTGAEALTVHRYDPDTGRHRGVLHSADAYKILRMGGPIDARETMPAGSVAWYGQRVALRRHQ